MNDPLSLHPCQHMVLSFKREKKKSSHSDGCAVVFHHGLNLHFPHDRASLVAQRLKCLPAMRETWVRSLGREDSLEKELATHSSTLAWRIPWTEEPGGLQSTGRKESDTTERLHFLSFTLYKQDICTLLDTWLANILLAWLSILITRSLQKKSF